MLLVRDAATTTQQAAAQVDCFSDMKKISIAVALLLSDAKDSALLWHRHQLTACDNILVIQVDCFSPTALRNANNNKQQQNKSAASPPPRQRHSR